jgi:hypothetical protein
VTKFELNLETLHRLTNNGPANATRLKVFHGERVSLSQAVKAWT